MNLIMSEFDIPPSVVDLIGHFRMPVDSEMYLSNEKSSIDLDKEKYDVERFKECPVIDVIDGHVVKPLHDSSVKLKFSIAFPFSETCYKCESSISVGNKVFYGLKQTEKPTVKWCETCAKLKKMDEGLRTGSSSNIPNF